MKNKGLLYTAIGVAVLAVSAFCIYGYVSSGSKVKLSYKEANAVSIANHTPEESVYFCSGLQGAAMQNNQKNLGKDIPTEYILTHTTEELQKVTGAEMSVISELVLAGYNRFYECFESEGEKFDECVEEAKKCQDVSNDFYGPLLEARQKNK